MKFPNQAMKAAPLKGSLGYEGVLFFELPCSTFPPHRRKTDTLPGMLRVRFWAQPSPLPQIVYAETELRQSRRRVRAS